MGFNLNRIEIGSVRKGGLHYYPVVTCLIDGIMGAAVEFVQLLRLASVKNNTISTL